MLVASFLLVLPGLLASCTGTECEDTPLLQTTEKTRKSALEVQASCEDPVKWPCGNEVIKSFALQVINEGVDCASGRANIKKLDLTTGMYTTLCYVEGYCLNACGINPETNLIYCINRPQSNDNLVRVDCQLDVAQVERDSQFGNLSDADAVEGKLCFFGRLQQQTWAAQFDDNGDFWYKETRQFRPPYEGRIWKITNATLAGLTNGRDTPRNNNVPNRINVMTRDDLGRVDDLNVVTLNFNNTGDKDYLVGCWGNQVFFQQVSGTDPQDVDPIILDMVGENPGSVDDSSGAQWQFDDFVYCAYNDGTSGVIQVLLDSISMTNMTNGNVDVIRVANSENTSSNDGLDCTRSEPPFVPPESTSTTGGGGIGDPHIHTLDGDHYLLLNQGSFSFWRFSGLDAVVASKKIPVDFQIFTHYSGHACYTKGLLLVDSTGQGAHPVLELTSEDCRWRRKSGASWRPLESSELIRNTDADGNVITAFNVTSTKQMHVELLMKSGKGFKKIGNVYAMCKPHHYINTKVSMFSKQDLRFVKGQLGGHHDSHVVGLLQGQQLRTDQDFQTSKSWEELGGSFTASTYLKQVDGEGVTFLQSCNDEEKQKAKNTCVKFMGSPTGYEIQKENGKLFASIFEDCVFDVCAGGGETAAQLAGEYMKSF